jgi:hypothetical protein
MRAGGGVEACWHTLCSCHLQENRRVKVPGVPGVLGLLPGRGGVLERGVDRVGVRVGVRALGKAVLVVGLGMGLVAGVGAGLGGGIGIPPALVWRAVVLWGGVVLVVGLGR